MNLKQVGLAFRVFANDNDDKYPFATQFREVNGQKDFNEAFTNSTDVWAHMMVMSNELGSARVLLCPGDRGRRGNMAVDFTTNSVRPNFGLGFQRNNAISYFVGLDAEETKPLVPLSGDADIKTGQFELDRNVLFVTTNRAAKWSGRHHGVNGTNGGNVAVSSGTVQLVGDGALQNLFELSELQTNRILLPDRTTP